MQIVIDIDPYVLEHCKRHVEEHYANNIEEAIVNGVPLEDIFGEIQAEIVEMRSKQNCSCADCLDIIDKYKAESEGER